MNGFHDFFKQQVSINALTNNLLFGNWVRFHTLPSNFRMCFTFLTQHSIKWLTTATTITLSLRSNHYPSYPNILPSFSLSCPLHNQSLVLLVIISHISHISGYYYLITKKVLISKRPTQLVAEQRMHFLKMLKIKPEVGVSLVVQWLRIRLPVQRTQVRVLVWEDPT